MLEGGYKVDKRAQSTGIEFLNMRLARAYIPFQFYTDAFPLEEALQKGTLFPELYRPYVAGVCCG